MTTALSHNPFGDTQSTYSTPAARTRRRGSWILTVLALILTAVIGVLAATWSMVTSVEDDVTGAYEKVYSLALIASSTNERDEVERLMRIVATPSADEAPPGSEPEIDQAQIDKDTADLIAEVTSPPPEIRPGDSTEKLREALIPTMTLCVTSLTLPPESPDDSVLYTTCSSFQDAVVTMLEETSAYNDTVGMLGPLSWGREEIPEFVGEITGQEPAGPPGGADMLDRLRNEGG